MVKKLLKLKFRFFVFTLLFLGVFSIFANAAATTNSSFSLLNNNVFVNAENNISKSYGENITLSGNLSFVNYLWVDTQTAEAGFKEVFQNLEVVLLKGDGLEVALAPVINCPIDITIECGNSTDPSITGTATATDACATINISYIDSSNQTSNGTCTDNSYIITRTWTATETCTNTIDSCIQTITVTDNTDPVLVGIPASATTSVDCSAIPAVPTVTATDNCDTAVPVIFTEASNTVVDGCGQIVRKWDVADKCGNAATFTQTITVTDNTDPVLVGIPASATTSVDCSAIPAVPTVTATDNCDTAVPVIFTEVSNTVVDGCGQIVRKWDVADKCGNAATFTQTITVTDITPPVITGTITPTTIEACSIAAASAAQTTVAGLEALTGDLTITDACTEDANILVSHNDVVSGSCPIVITRTYTLTDACGNTSTVISTINIEDTTNPTASNPLPITVSGTKPLPDITVVTDEADNCTAIPTVSWVSDVSNGSCPEIVTRIYRVADNCGNFINVTQLITITEIIAPIARCKANFTVQLNNVDGTATITANDIDNGSSDNCGIAMMTVSPNTFTCADIGNNNVILTVTDIYGNVAACASTVIVEAPTIDSGTLTGYLDTDGPANASDIINVTSCPYDPITGTPAVSNAFLNLDIPLEFQDDILRWEFSVNGGYSWSPIANTTTTYTYSNIMVTTLVRAVIQVGTCVEYSPRVILNVIPPEIKPTIIGATEFDSCLGDSVTVVAQSEYANNQLVNEGGLFNFANPEDWRIDGDDDKIMPALASTTSPNIWSESTSGKVFHDIQYDTQDGKKFAIANGDYYTTLETPIFNTLGLEDVFLSFDQFYWLQSGAEIKIEISMDGGVTYNTMLDPGTNIENGSPHDYTGPSNTATLPGTPPKNIPKANFVHTEINLQDYIGLTNLRVRFTFDSGGTLASAWALDNVSLPDTPVNEVIEWTDSDGNVVTTGNTTTITTVTPGIQVYGATALINSCRAPGDEGTEFITINASLAYAGENISPVTGECGDNKVSLNAYDNEKTAQQNYDNGVRKLGVYIYPGESYDHDNDVNTPNRIGVDYPGTGEIGEWTVTSAPSSSCGAGYAFSNKNSPTSTFTGEVGTYTLTWTVAGCTSTVQVTINSCSSIDFDGDNDYVTFYDNYDFTGPFSIETWVKPESIIGTQSIFSKRDANNLFDGYDLSLNGGIVSFNWNNGSSISSSPYVIGTDRWYHVAVTFDGTYRLYIDGIEVNNTAGSVPTTNTFDCLLGAMNKIGATPENYFNGWMDEFRIWNKAIDVQHLRQMMNQEVKLSGSDDVMGEVIPIKVSGPDNDLNGTDDDILLWSHLSGYYRFDVDCGYLTAYKGLNGRLRNIEDSLSQTAPIPYTTKSNGNWNDTTASTPWTYGDSVWDYPNAKGVDGTTDIDWNIVETSNNVISIRSNHTSNPDKDLTLLGLIVNSGSELTITDIGTQDENNNGQGLWITHYLKLDGQIDLVGESQLLQKRYGIYDGLGNFSTTQFSESIFDAASTGYIERDQQGQKNSFNYNYWSSPVTRQSNPNNVPYTVANILRDGTDSANPRAINFVDGAFSADTPNGTNPIKITSRWIWTYNAVVNGDPWADYYQWKNVGYWGSIKVGDGYTMKGTGGTAPITAMQNYVFVGKPNSGDILTTQLNLNQTYLIGNPYPSALDANEFIKNNLKDCSGCNGSANVFNGALYFWDHFTNSNNHLLAQYEGGYATLNLMGGVVAISNVPLTASTNNSGSKIPERFIPVGQGFFVESTLPILSGTGTALSPGNLYFKNSQRVFKRETVTGLNSGSVFMKTAVPKKPQTEETTAESRPIIRLTFDSPLGYRRPLLVGVDEYTSNQFDFGYDAPLNEDNKEDMFWLIGNGKFVIQGVNNFDKNQVLPLGVKVDKSGLITIKIEETINIGNNVSIFIKDKLTGKSTRINKKPFEINLDPGEYLDRFALIFSPDNNKNKMDVIEKINEIYVFMNNAIAELQIKNNGTDEIRSITLYNNLGQTMIVWNKDLNRRIISLPVKLATGVYVVQINTKQGTSINKRIIIE